MSNGQLVQAERDVPPSVDNDGVIIWRSWVIRFSGRPRTVPRSASIGRLQISAPIVRLVNTTRPLEVAEAENSSVEPNVTRCGASLTARSGAMATCHVFDASPTLA
jgi:hypothetical protein